MKKLNLCGIKCEGKHYITTKELIYERSHYNGITTYISKNTLINGEEPQLAFHKNWFIINGEPKHIQKYVSQKNVNYRYELIDKSFLSDKIPEILKCEDVIIDGSSYYEKDWKPEYKNYASLYELKSDPQPNILEDIEFNYEFLLELHNIEEPENFSYKIKADRDTKKEIITDQDLQHQMIDELIFPDIILHTKSCKLTSKQSYEIVRHYIKENIDGNVAKITSDYDFCFTVKKLIPLTEIEEYTVDVNNSIFQKRKRKPKYVKKYIKHREIECFEMAPKEYKGYSIITGFYGKNQKDLKKNIDNYCENLIEFINKPVTECPHCKGYGVLIEKLK